MRTQEDILQDLAAVQKQRQDLDREIEAKRKDLAAAKVSNAALLEKSLAAARKPASISTQRQKIRSLRDELEGLEELAPMLDRKADDLTREMETADAFEDLQAFQKKAKDFFVKLGRALDILEAAKGLGEDLGPLVEDLRKDNPILDLNSILMHVDRDQLNAMGFSERNAKGFKFMSRVVPLEKDLKSFSLAVKSLSDLAFSLEFNQLNRLAWPEEDRGPVSMPDQKTGRVHAENPKVARQMENALAVG